MANGITSYATASEVRAQLAHAAAGTEIEIRGAGLTGIELAAEIAYRRPELVVHLAGRAPVGAELPDRAKDYLRCTLERLGVQADSEAPQGSASVDARGLRRASLAHDSALEVSGALQLLVSPTLEAMPGVWGAGDAALVQSQPHLRASCATAIPMGAHAADNIARSLRGEAVHVFDFGYAIRCISLGRRSGLIVSVDGYDEPTGGFVAGVRGAWIKAAVVQGVLLTATSLARSYSWPAAEKRGRGRAG
jgi:NADH dehydrogenase FAD-containing subunit